jgi:hypothetical protein
MPPLFRAHFSHKVPRALTKSHRNFRDRITADAFDRPPPGLSRHTADRCRRVFALLAASPASGAAEKAASTVAPAAAPATPLTDFRTQLGEMKKSLAGVNAKIDDQAKAIEKLSKPDAARQQIEDLQALISETLGLVADNGEIATLGQKALDYSRGKQEQMRKDTKFTASERAALQRRWDTNVTEVTKATDELTKASNEFAQLLKTIQTAVIMPPKSSRSKTQPKWSRSFKISPATSGALGRR